MDDQIYKPNSLLLRHLYEELNDLKEKFNSIVTKIENNPRENSIYGSKHTESVSLEKNIADLSLSLMKILYEEKDSRTLKPFILSIISEEEKIFHPLRTSKFQLIHTEGMTTGSEKEVHSQQQISVFTIPMLYARSKVYNNTKEDKEEIERNKKSLAHITPTMIWHFIPVVAQKKFEEYKSLFISLQVQGRTFPETYEFTYEFPFEKETNKLLNLREWLDQQVICINHRTFTIEEIIKEVRNKIAAHQSATLKIPKESFFYNTKFMDFGHPYWFYFIFFCVDYIVFAVGKILNKKDDANFKMIDPFKARVIVRSLRPIMFSEQVFSHEAIESFLVWSNNISFAANVSLDSDIFEVPFYRLVLISESDCQFYDIPLMVLFSMVEKIKKGEELELYFHLTKCMCGFGSKFKSGADFVLYFIKKENNKFPQMASKSFANIPTITMQIFTHNFPENNENC